VEVVVFAYAENVSVGSEVFPADEPVYTDDEVLYDADELRSDAGPLAVDAQQMRQNDAMPPADAEVSDLPGARLSKPILMIDDDFSMLRTLEQLERLDAYEPLMHFGWTQATFPLEQSRPIEIGFFGKPPEGLGGSFTLYLERYLHLVVDLVLDDPDQEGPERPFDQQPIISFGDDRTLFEQDLRPEDGRVRFRLQENRIIKNGDIRYFDHPKFGVIAKVIRVEDEEEEEGETAEPQQLLSRFGQ
jgi:hypothetical protein